MTRRTFGHVQVPFKRIHIELTNVCDFNCVFCPKSLMDRKYGYMDPDLAKRVIDEIGARGLAEKITFHVMGEPTLHPQFFEILEHALARKVPVGLTTNAGGLSGPIGERLLSYNLAQIDLSLQTPDERSFALRKAKGLTFEKYLGGILNFFAKYRYNFRDTTFKFRFLNTTFPPKAMEEKTGPIRVISSARELREVFSFWTTRIYDIMEVDQGLKAKALERVRKLAPWKWNVVEVLPNTFFETYLLSDWGHAFSGKPVREAWAGYCFGMRDHFAILHNGDVVLCCIDFNGKTAIGNVQDSSLEEILSGDELGEIMQGFKKYKLTHPYCRHCLGSTSTLSWLTKPIVQIGALRLLKPYFYKHTRLYG